MKLLCKREQLLQAFQAVASVAPARSPKPILQNVKLEVEEDVATFLATDLEIGIRYQVDGIEIQTPGAVVLPVGRFGAILRECSDETLSIETTGQKTVIQGDRNQFNLSTEDPNEFPPVTLFEEQSYYTTTARWIKGLIHRTLFATDNESSRYALGGIKFEWSDGTLIGIGTDGRRLAKMEGPVEKIGEAGSFGDATIVPGRSLQILDRALSDDDQDLQIAVRQNEILFKSPRAMINSRLLEGRFPGWQDVFPKRTSSSKIELPVASFFSAIRQAAIVTSEDSRGVKFCFSDGSLLLSAHAAQVGESRIELPVAYQGDELTISLDPRYLADFLKVLQADSSFTFDLQDGENAAVCTTDDGYGYVIMPLAGDR